MMAIIQLTDEMFNQILEDDGAFAEYIKASITQAVGEMLESETDKELEKIMRGDGSGEPKGILYATATARKRHRHA
jgi:hypothetical protein